MTGGGGPDRSGGSDGTLMVPVPAAGPERYPVEVAPGALERLGRRCREAADAGRWAVISDERVGDLYGERALRSLESAGARGELFTFPEGESSKTRESWARLTDRLLDWGLNRDGAVVALGGGVTGDLAGFVAATYVRGVPVVQVPTSLLAMVDSSVGGKTGVNTRAGKNLVGAFHHPAHVLIDTELLSTLDGRQLRAGLAEALKAGAIADPELFGWMERNAGRLADGTDPEAAARLVRRAVAVKVEVVARDPEEAGRRAVLNFGHTLGHALEATAEYRGLHGEAVAAGMCLEARWGERRGATESGTADRLRAAAGSLDIRPWPVDDADAAELIEAARLDKKARRDTLRMVLLERIGRVARPGKGEWTHPVDEDRLRSWLPGALRSEAETTV